MSIWSLFLQASIIVKTIMIGLLLISIYSWTLIFQKLKNYKQTSKQISAFEEKFWSGTDLNNLYESVTTRENESSGIARVFIAGFREYLRSKQQPIMTTELVIENIARMMKVAMHHEAEHLENRLPFLATVGSVSPYVGLFGTVWGIMQALISLGAVQQATLNMVAPGIAEALVATAMGLFAAIPAVIAYNRFGQTTNKLLGRYEIFFDEFISILQRKLQAKTVN